MINVHYYYYYHIKKNFYHSNVFSINPDDATVDVIEAEQQANNGAFSTSSVTNLYVRKKDLLRLCAAIIKDDTLHDLLSDSSIQATQHYKTHYNHNQHLMLLTPTHSLCYQCGSAAMRLLALPVSYRGKLKIRNKEENGEEYSTLSPHINQYGGCRDDILRGVQEVHGGH